MQIKSIKKIGIELRGQRVLVRCDFNVPIENGKILDDFKPSQALITINYLMQKKAKVILLTHLGRVESEKDKESSITQPIAARLSKLLKKSIKYVDDCVGLRVGTAVSDLKDGETILLENIRFESGEAENSLKLAKELSKLADIFVFDAFAVSHRRQASVTAIRKFLPCYAGLLLEGEIENLSRAFKPEYPLVLVMGGVKLETKMPLLARFIKTADKILVGGALANNFLAARGYGIGRSLADEKSVKLAKKIKSDKILLPVDVVVGRKKRHWETHCLSVNRIGNQDYIFDIGPKTIRLYAGIIREAKTIIWNGPMGMFENDDYRHGTLAIARTIAARSTGRAFGLAGGGETVSALRQTKMIEHVDWVSTGGGAMLSYLSGEKLPGLEGLVHK